MTLEDAARDLLQRLRHAQRETTGEVRDRIRGHFEADALDLLEAHIILPDQETHV
ncbi:hypothetical protein [Streptomyces yaizuensis]|uniref:Uncharacterized protein n=1 Tax=Streptomyces yaizuensis TaxID=2989713 RepID=A0ABQ5P6S9_9ACTN|nr:hypothetical protein [Streptomyces sp. YSPA8]GLF98264.1 hypothetical protein SYYSPA8_28225 [Streptomyces sp. YSPA8]